MQCLLCSLSTVHLAASVLLREPVLLVGETGIGKTAVIQHLAQQVCHRSFDLHLTIACAGWQAADCAKSQPAKRQLGLSWRYSSGWLWQSV